MSAKAIVLKRKNFLKYNNGNYVAFSLAGFKNAVCDAVNFDDSTCTWPTKRAVLKSVVNCPTTLPAEFKVSLVGSGIVIGSSK